MTSLYLTIANVPYLTASSRFRSLAVVTDSSRIDIFSLIELRCHNVSTRTLLVSHTDSIRLSPPLADEELNVG